MIKQSIYSLTMFLVAVCLIYATALAATIKAPLERPAIMSLGAAHSVLLDITRAGNRLVAVGERGIVVLSDDAGHTWRQANIPMSVSLTAVEFPTAKQGWIVGHSGVVLHTQDGGENWALQLDGVVAARLALDAAKANVADVGLKDTVASRQLREAKRLVNDGADKPFLDLHFTNDKEGFIIGAYGLMFRTVDGGETWQPWMDHVDNPRGMNLYDIQAVGDILYIVGEQGLAMKSTDGGDSFARIKTPYEGTYFVAAAGSSGEIVVAGLRGNAYFSADQGITFTQVNVPIPVSFSATTTLEDGTLLFANQAGELLASRDGGRTLRILDTPRLPPVAAMEYLGDGTLFTVGFGGVIPVPLSGWAPTAKIGESK